jgi:hypothetical protein
MPLPLLALGLSGGSILSGLLGNKKKKKAAKIEQLAVRLQNQQARSAALKEFRIARAQAITGIIASGADLRSSAYQGIKGSLQSQIQENARFSLEQESLGQQANKQRQKAASFDFIAGALSSGAGIAEGIRTLRQGTPPPTTTTQVPIGTNPNMNPSPFIFNSNK